MIWLGAASNCSSFSSHTLHPSQVLAKSLGLTTTRLSGLQMQPEQDWLPISIPQTYLIVTASSEEEADGVALITPLLLGDFPHPWTFSLMLLDIAEARENPDHPGRASAHTGSAISPREFPKAPPGSCNKPSRPFVPWWTGSRLSKAGHYSAS